MQLQKPADNFLFINILYHKIILLNQRYRQLFLGDFYQLGILLIFVRNIQNRLRHGSGKQRRLMLVFYLAQNSLHILAESHIQHLIRLVKNNHLHILNLDGMPAHMVHDTPGRPDNNLYAALQCLNLSADVLPAVNRNHFYIVHIFRKFSKLICRLNCQLPRRAQNDTLQAFVIFIYSLQHRNPKCRRFSCAGLRLPDNVSSLHQNRYCLLLDRRHILITHFCYRTQDSLVYPRVFIAHIFAFLRLCIRLFHYLHFIQIHLIYHAFPSATLLKTPKSNVAKKQRPVQRTLSVNFYEPIYCILLFLKSQVIF